MIAIVISQSERIKELDSFIHDLQSKNISFVVICPSEKVLSPMFDRLNHPVIPYLSDSQFRKLNLQANIDLLRANVLLRLRQGSTLGVVIEKLVLAIFRTLRVLKSGVKRKKAPKSLISSSHIAEGSQWLSPHHSYLLRALNDLCSTAHIERIEVFDLQDLVSIQNDSGLEEIEIQLR
jgi:hypothetical protein